VAAPAPVPVAAGAAPPAPAERAVVPVPALAAVGPGRGKSAKSQAPWWQNIPQRVYALLGKLTPRGWPLMMVGALAVVLFHGADGPVSQVTRTLAAVATVAEGTADLAVSALQSTGNVSNTMGTWALNVLSTSQSWGQDAWDGRDLVGVRWEARSGSIGGDAVAPIVTWLRSEPGRRLHGGGPDFVDMAQVALDSLQPEIPFISSSRMLANTGHNYSFVKVTAAWARNGLVLLDWHQAAANYSVVWANPFWELAGLDPAGDGQSIHYMLHDYFDHLPPPPVTRPVSVTLSTSIYEAMTYKADSWRRWISSALFGLPWDRRLSGRGLE